MNIHFICRGNILRSLVAETYLKSLNLKNITIISSGTDVNWEDEKEKEYFFDTLTLLDRHGVKEYVKGRPEQLTQVRANNQDITVCMNQRVIDEAEGIVVLPRDTLNWNVIDIGEGHRTDRASKAHYLEEIYQEITQMVDELVKANDLR